MERKMFWPWRKQEKKEIRDDEVMAAAVILYVATVVNAIFMTLTPNQQGAVKEKLRIVVANMGTLSVPPSIPPIQAQRFRDLLSAHLQLTISLRPDQQDIAAGIDKVLERMLQGAADLYRVRP